jgi:glycosyltransferase involved in cell wall biosynthesis
LKTVNAIPGSRRVIPQEASHGLISVIIPSYESKWCVEEAIESVFNQTYKPIEIIVVNDGSTDGTSEFLESKYGNRIEILNQPNGGLANARNTGLQNSRGEFIQFLDADDAISYGKIEKQVAFFRMNPEIACVTSYYYEVSMNSEAESSDCHITLEGKRIADFLLRNCVGPVHCPLVRRSAIAAIGGFDENFHNYCADWELWLTMAVLGYKYACLEEPLAVYRRHSKSLTKEKVLPNMIGDLNIAKRGLQYAKILCKTKEWQPYDVLSLRCRKLTEENKKHRAFLPCFVFFLKGLYYSMLSCNLKNMVKSLMALIK